MNPKFPVIELFDRLVIARIKWYRTGANRDELNFYENEILVYNTDPISNLIEQLTKVHNHIWDLEKELKSGQEQNLCLSEIGRRAIEIRDWNSQRISLKNQIAEILGDPVREIKQDHVSARTSTC